MHSHVIFMFHLVKCPYRLESRIAWRNVMISSMDNCLPKKYPHGW